MLAWQRRFIVGSVRTGTSGLTRPQRSFHADDAAALRRDREPCRLVYLDYFLARYYSSAQGRFTSPDEFVGGPDELYDFAGNASENPTFYADLFEPQSLNKYQFGYNNPLRYVDKDGHQTRDRYGNRTQPGPPGTLSPAQAKALAEATDKILTKAGDAEIYVLNKVWAGIKKLGEANRNYGCSGPHDAVRRPTDLTTHETEAKEEGQDSSPPPAATVGDILADATRVPGGGSKG